MFQISNSKNRNKNGNNIHDFMQSNFIWFRIENHFPCNDATVRVAFWLMQHAIHFISFQLLTIIEVDVMLCMKSALDEKKRKKRKPLVQT